MNDTQRAKLVDIIDIRYWHYKVDGLYAPEGGKNLADRKSTRLNSSHSGESRMPSSA